MKFGHEKFEDMMKGIETDPAAEAIQEKAKEEQVADANTWDSSKNKKKKTTTNIDISKFGPGFHSGSEAMDEWQKEHES